MTVVELSALLAVAAPPGGDLEPVVLDDVHDRYPVGVYLELLEDPRGRFSVQEVTSAPLEASFVRSDRETPSKGYTESVWWARLVVRDDSHSTNGWLLEMAFPPMDDWRLWVEEGGSLQELQRLGDLEPFDERPIDHANYVVPLALAPGATVTYVMRFATTSTMLLPITIWSPKEYQSKVYHEQLFYGVFVGSALALLVLNLIMFFLLRDRSYLYYVLVVGSWSVYALFVSGHVFQFVLASHPQLANWANPFAGLNAVLWSLLFTRDFLMTKRLLPHFDRLVVAIAGLAAAAIVLSPFLPVRAMAQAISLGGPVLLVIVVVAALRARTTGFRPATSFLIGWAAFLLRRGRRGAAQRRSLAELCVRDLRPLHRRLFPEPPARGGGLLPPADAAGRPGEGARGVAQPDPVAGGDPRQTARHHPSQRERRTALGRTGAKPRRPTIHGTVRRRGADGRLVAGGVRPREERARQDAHPRGNARARRSDDGCTPRRPGRRCRCGVVPGGHYKPRGGACLPAA